ncbi:hypothetical protein F5888DRAFT_1809472 [Russula emetica]|nr:hypothetical protein F5888DRAFT_1809472 [Russula emetica]
MSTIIFTLDHTSTLVIPQIILFPVSQVSPPPSTHQVHPFCRARRAQGDVFGQCIDRVVLVFTVTFVGLFALLLPSWTHRPGALRKVGLREVVGLVLLHMKALTFIDSLPVSPPHLLNLDQLYLISGAASSHADVDSNWRINIRPPSPPYYVPSRLLLLTNVGRHLPTQHRPSSSPSIEHTSTLAMPPKEHFFPSLPGLTIVIDTSSSSRSESAGGCGGWGVFALYIDHLRDDLVSVSRHSIYILATPALSSP